jgi:hypothetical protein
MKALPLNLNAIGVSAHADGVAAKHFTENRVHTRALISSRFLGSL